jgi:hypothetical protein
MNSRLNSLILVRLLVPGKRGLSRGDLKKALEPFFQSRQTTGAFSELLDGALSELSASGLITAKPLGLTEPGRKQGLEFLCIDALPPRWNWKGIKNAFLMGRVLELRDQTAEARKRLATADGLRAAILSKSHNLLTGDTPSLPQALQALAWKQLGVESSEPFTLQAVLARALGLDGKPDRKKVGELLPAKAVSARNTKPDELRLTVIYRWLDNSPNQAQPPAHKGDEMSFNLAGFAEAVNEAARTAPTGRFGDHKVFISHVWRWLQEQRAFPTMDEAKFKSRLAEANQAGLLALSRADLVEAMNPEDVRSSETPYLNATFHFVQV